MTEQLILNVFLIAIVGIAVMYDLRTRRIPNRLVLCGVIGGILLNAIGGMDAFFAALLGLGLAVGIGFVPFALGWLGAGDVKFLGAVGAIAGVSLVPRVFLFTAIAGALLALASLAIRRGRGFRASTREIFSDLKTLVLTQGRVLPDGVSARASKGAATIPYGVAIGIGALVAVYGSSVTLSAGH